MVDLLPEDKVVEEEDKGMETGEEVGGLLCGEAGSAACSSARGLLTFNVL